MCKKVCSCKQYGPIEKQKPDKDNAKKVAQKFQATQKRRGSGRG